MSSSWIKLVGTPGQSDYLGGFAEWNGNQYVCNGNPIYAKIYEWDGASGLTPISDSKGLAINTNLVYSNALNRFVATFGNNIALHNGVSLPWDSQNPAFGFYGEQYEETNTIVVAVKGESALIRTDGTNGNYVSQSASGLLKAAINFDGEFYVTDLNGYLWQWNKSHLLVLKSQIVNEAIISLAVHNNVLYGASTQGRLFRWNGADAWTVVADNLPGVSIDSILSHEGYFFGATATGKVYAWNGVDAWTAIATDNEAWTLSRMFSYNGDIYCVGYGTGGGLFKLIPDSYIDLLSRGISSSETFGMPILPNQIILNGIASSEAFGIPTVNNELQIICDGILSSETFGIPGLGIPLIIFPWGIGSAEAFGSHIIKRTTNINSELPPPIPDKEGDMRFVLETTDGYADIVMTDRDVDRDAGFETAVLITIGTDRRADEEDNLPDGGGYRGGYWGDSVPDVPNDLIGCKLWLLKRSKGTERVIAEAAEYLREGFQWMFDDEVVSNIDISVERVDGELLNMGDSVLAMSLNFERPGLEDIFYKFYYNWEAQILRRG